MRRAAFFVTVLMFASFSAVSSAGVAGVELAAVRRGLAGPESGGPRATVSFVQAVSGQTPFTDNCGAAGEPFVDAEVEPHLSVNPTNPHHLLATWQQDRYPGGGARSNLAAVSHNGGKSWRSTTLPGVSSCTGGERLKAGDPWTAIGADGAAYVASFAVTDPDARGEGLVGEFDGDTVLNRSRSGGATWDTSTPVAEDDGTFWHEKAIIAADPHAPETLYAVWGRHLMPDPTPLFATLDVAAVFSRSDDGGRTWSEAVALPPDLPEVNEWPFGGLLVLPLEAGEGPPRLVVVAAAVGARIAVGDSPCLLYSTTSSDVGETWSDPVVIATPPNAPPTGDYERIIPIRGGTPCLVSAASSPDGTAYAAWFERTLDGDGPGGARIRFARSEDGGTTWTSGVVAEVPSQAFLPTIAVAGDGTVGVTYFDNVADELGDDELTTDLRFASSADRGETWEYIDVAGPFDLRTAPNANGYMLGDYFGLVGLPDGFGSLVALPEPIAERGPTDIFFARITLDGSDR